MLQPISHPPAQTGSLQDGVVAASILCAAVIVANRVPAREVPALFSGMVRLVTESADAPIPGRTPAVDVEDSVHDDYIICLEDGKRFRSLKRHLRKFYGLSPADYRARWGLPDDYPMTAPSYSRVRRDMAFRSGLGRRKGKAS